MVGIYMNLELLALEIADEHISQMVVDPEKDIHNSGCYSSLQDNIKHGWIATIMLYNYVESVTNTILRDCINYSDNKLMKCSIEEKLEIIYLYYKADISKLREIWEAYITITKVRNELVHYKSNYIGEGTGFPAFGSKLFNKMIELFTFTKMKKIKQDIVIICNKIISDCGLELNQWVTLFASDGRDGLVSYIYDARTSDFCDSRHDDPPSELFIKHILYVEELAMFDKFTGVIDKLKEAINLVSDYDVKQKLFEAQDTMLEIQEENRKLKERLALSEQIIYHEQPYITIKDRKGYYCSNCYGKNTVLIQLQDLNLKETAKRGCLYEWRCSECNNKNQYPKIG